MEKFQLKCFLTAENEKRDYCILILFLRNTPICKRYVYHLDVIVTNHSIKNRSNW